MSFCSRCGTESAPGVKFCPKCGNALEATNVGGAPAPVTPTPAVAIPNPLANIDIKDPTILLSLISAVGVLFTFIGGLVFSLGDYYEATDRSVFMYILTLLAFMAPSGLATLYFLNIGGIGKNRMMLTVNFASLAAYPFFSLIANLVNDSFTLHTFIVDFGIIAAACLAIYCGIGGFTKKTIFIIAIAAAIALEGGVLGDMSSAISLGGNSSYFGDVTDGAYFWAFCALFAFVARIATYISLLLFVTGKKEEA